MKRQLFRTLSAFWLGMPGVHTGTLQAQPQDLTAGRVPDEYESIGGHSLGLGNGAVAAVAGQSAVRGNPAMMTMEKIYSLSAGYHWASVGRDFYQLGVVDSKTSPVAAGVMYTGSGSNYHPMDDVTTRRDKTDSYFDSPLSRRVSLGFAQAFEKVSAGLGGSYVEYKEEGKLVKGSALNLGLAALFTRDLRFGLSAENMANRKISNVAPKTYRAGIAYTMFEGFLTLHLDGRQRERVSQEGPVPQQLLASEVVIDHSTDIDLSQPERMGIASATVQFQDVLRLLMAYSQTAGGPARQSLSGGIALINQNFSLSYSVSQPYLSSPRTHQAANLSMNVAM